MSLPTPPKLRLLIITMGGDRKAHIEEMFSSCPSLSREFEITFSDGIPSRSIRTKVECFKVFFELGIVDGVGFDAFISKTSRNMRSRNDEDEEQHLDKWAAESPPINPPTPTPTPASTPAPEETEENYNTDLWKRVKTLGRERSVLACSLAHLRAMKLHVSEAGGFDVILEDNVRILKTLTSENASFAAKLIRDGIASAIVKAKLESDAGKSEGLGVLYFGYLGPVDSIQWTYDVHVSRGGGSGDGSEGVVEFPFYGKSGVKQVFLPEDEFLKKKEIVKLTKKQQKEADIIFENENSTTAESKGGESNNVSLWGAYAYTVTPAAYICLINTIKTDIGKLLWKTKRMKTYKVKPIDRLLPTNSNFSGNLSVYMLKKPVFFRAPMLDSKIHKKFDKEFCKSTDLQLSLIERKWSDLWLTKDEKLSVENYLENGVWGGEEVEGEREGGGWEVEIKAKADKKLAAKKSQDGQERDGKERKRIKKENQEKKDLLKMEEGGSWLTFDGNVELGVFAAVIGLVFLGFRFTKR